MQVGDWGVAAVAGYLPVLTLLMGLLGWRSEHWWLLWLPCMRQHGCKWQAVNTASIVYSALTFGFAHALMVALGVLSVVWETRSLSEVCSLRCCSSLLLSY